MPTDFSLPRKGQPFSGRPHLSSYHDYQKMRPLPKGQQSTVDENPVKDASASSATTPRQAAGSNVKAQHSDATPGTALLDEIQRRAKEVEKAKIDPANVFGERNSGAGTGDRLGSAAPEANPLVLGKNPLVADAEARSASAGSRATYTDPWNAALMAEVHKRAGSEQQHTAVEDNPLLGEAKRRAALHAARA